MTDHPIKVILVDDEGLVRDLLKRCVDWSGLGMTIVGEAASAHEAIDLVDKLRPEIVFTDICMPFMDGIELSKMILDKYPRTAVVIVTGYEDFEYAQRSIKAGVTDFVLKPINDEEITKVALNVKARIENEKAHFNEYNLLKKQLEENFPYLKEKFLNELLLQSLESTEIENRFCFYKISVKTTTFQVVIVEITEDDKEQNQEEWLIFRMRCHDLVRKHLEQEASMIVFLDHSQRTVMINSADSLELIACCERLKNILIQQQLFSFCIGVGNPHQGFENIRVSYHEANNALKHKILIGKNEVICYRDIDFSITERQFFSHEQLDMFYFYLKAGMKEQALEVFDNFLKKLMKSGDISPDQLKVMASNIISIILNTITELGINVVNIFGSDLQPYDQVFKIDNLPEMNHYLKEITATAVSSIHHLQHRKVSKVVQDVREYLIKNFDSQDLSLATVAKVFYLNPSYLSRVFRLETKQTFVEYLTEIRMEKAIKLVKETHLKTYEVAEKVGITDPHYFGVCFKKYTGLSVNDYKRGQS